MYRPMTLKFIDQSKIQHNRYNMTCQLRAISLIIILGQNNLYILKNDYIHLQNLSALLVMWLPGC